MATASRTVSVRLTVAEADVFRTAMQNAGMQGTNAFKTIATAAQGSTGALHNHTQAGQLANYQIIEMAESAHKFADGLLAGGSALKLFFYEAPKFVGIAGGLGNALGAIAKIAPFLGLAAAAAGLVALGVAANNEESRLRTLGQQVRATRDDYDGYAKTLDTTARKLAVTTTFGLDDARKTVNTIGTDANFTGNTDDIRRLAVDAQNLSVVLKTDLAGGTKIVTDGLANTSKAAKDLQEKGFAGFTPQLVRQIELLQQSGKYADAFALYLQTLEARTKGAAVAGLTPMGEALHQLSRVFTEAREGGKSFADIIGGYIDERAANGIRSIATLTEWFVKLATATRAANHDIAEFTVDPATGMTIPNVQPAPAAPAAAPPAYRPVPSSNPTSYDSMRDRLAKEYGVDPEVVSRLNRTEGHRNADGSWQNSSSGAVGGFQLLPGTFAQQQKKYGFPGEITDDTANARAGITYYKEQLARRGGNATQAYYDYHDGPAARYVSSAALQAGQRGFGDYTGSALTGADGGGMVNGARKDAEDVAKIVEGTRAVTSEALAAKLEDVQRQIRRLDTEGKKDTPEYRGLLEREQTTRAAQYNLVDPQTEATRTTQRQLDSARLSRRYGFTPAGDQLQADIAKREDIARTSGAPVTDEVRNQVTTQFYAKATMELERLETTQKLAVTNTERLGAAYLKGTSAVQDMTAKNEALHQIGLILPKDAANYTAALERLTQSYRDVATAAADAREKQKIAGADKEIAALNEQSRLIKSGAGPDAQATGMAVFTARQQAEGASTSVQDLAAATAKQKSEVQQSLQSTRANYAELDNFATTAFDRIGASITGAFTQGKGAAVSFGSITKSIISEVEQEFVKLAVLNPLKNAISGGNSALPTLNGVLGASGTGSGLLSLFGGGGNASATNSALGSLGGVDGPATAAQVAAAASSGGGGLFSGIGSFVTSLFHSGGIVGSESRLSRQIDPAVFHLAPRLHSGGIAGDEMPAVLKAGEGVFTAGQMAALAPAGSQGSGDNHVHFNINAQGAGPREIDQLRSQIPLMALATVQSAMSRGGSFARSVRG